MARSKVIRVQHVGDELGSFFVVHISSYHSSGRILFGRKRRIRDPPVRPIGAISRLKPQQNQIIRIP